VPPIETSIAPSVPGVPAVVEMVTFLARELVDQHIALVEQIVRLFPGEL
jgi:hypothetical protein